MLTDDGCPARSNFATTTMDSRGAFRDHNFVWLTGIAAMVTAKTATLPAVRADEFVKRGLAAREEVRRTGVYYTAEFVLDELEAIQRLHESTPLPKTTSPS